MVDPSILTTSSFRLTEQDLKGPIHEGPTYICDSSIVNEVFKPSSNFFKKNFCNTTNTKQVKTK